MLSEVMVSVMVTSAGFLAVTQKAFVAGQLQHLCKEDLSTVHVCFVMLYSIPSREPFSNLYSICAQTTGAQWVTVSVVEAANVQQAKTFPHSQNAINLLNKIQGATTSICPVWMSDFQQHKCLWGSKAFKALITIINELLWGENGLHSPLLFDIVKGNRCYVLITCFLWVCRDKLKSWGGSVFSRC